MDYSQLLSHFGERLKKNEPLAKYTTLKIGGPADLFLTVTSKEECLHAVTAAIQAKIPFFILGGGSNILIGDGGFRGLVIKDSANKISLRGMKSKVVTGVNERFVFVEADAGVIMNHLVRFTIEEGLSGLEMHLGLPGTVGGAVYMNSKWTHPTGYVGDAVYQAQLLDAAGQVRVVPQSYFHFGYDYSCLQKTHETILSVVFALRPDAKDRLWSVATDSITYRRATQPQGVSSPGCTFRNISKAQAIAIPTPDYTTSAGFLIDHAGMKGIAEGDAQISPVHANFIVNKGKATAADVVKLIDRSKKAVHKKFGVLLEEEIVRVGEFL